MVLPSVKHTFPGTKNTTICNGNVDDIPNIRDGIKQHAKYTSPWYTEYRWVLFWHIGLAAGWRRQWRQNRKHAEWDYYPGNPDEKINYREWFEREGDDGWQEVNPGVTQAVTWPWASPDNVDQWSIHIPIDLTLSTTKPLRDGQTPAPKRPVGSDSGDSADVNQKIRDEIPTVEEGTYVFGKTSGVVNKNDYVDEILEMGKRTYIGQVVTSEFINATGHVRHSKTNVRLQPGKKFIIQSIQVVDKVRRGYYDINDQGQKFDITYAEYLIILRELKE